MPRWPRMARCIKTCGAGWPHDAKARLAGLDDESIEALFMTTFRTASQEDIA
ncbi:hypothetical protein [Nonomuraea sp. NPDC046570]|uniref:hypothetical protein n=1 Tax=Nonomuraea sp. NPDC046570 TaxID=3155255 RepID=UPI0033E43CDF